MTKRPQRSVTDSLLARGGGNATTAGVEFEAKLGAWFASQLLAERPLDQRLTGKRLLSVRFETEAPVDDILVETANGWIFVQAKTSLTLSSSSESELRKTVEQFVRQWLACSTGDGSRGWDRPLRQDRDRFLLALGPGASKSLSTDLARSLGADGEASRVLHVPLPGRRVRDRKDIIIPGDAGTLPRRLDRSLVLAVARGRTWASALRQHEYADTAEIAAKYDLSEAYVRRILRLAFLAPAIVEAIAEGRQPRGLTLQRLLGSVPLAWAEQRRQFGLTI